MGVAALPVLFRDSLANVQRLIAAALFCIALSTTVFAQAADQPAPKSFAPPEMVENCPGLVAAHRPRVIPAAFDLAALNADQVRLTYIGHATFLIESPQLVRIATDYNDYVRPPVLPDIVTMNHAHSTHYTDRPDPDIKFVLRGWRDDGKPANHHHRHRIRHVASHSTWCVDVGHCPHCKRVVA